MLHTQCAYYKIRYNMLVVYMYGKYSKISNAFLILFSNKMMIIRAEIHKLLVRKANREDPDQTASEEAV